MNAFRYWYGLLAVAFGSGALLHWLSIHRFVGTWRRVGTAPTLVIHWSFALVLAALVLWQRERVMVGDLGTQPILAALGACVLVVSVVLRAQQARAFSTARLLGVPELDPARADNTLVTTGIYARIRHPRYVQIWLAMAGCALIVNFASTYLFVAFVTAVIARVVPLEERELLGRFGAAYRDYCSRVPRFVPKR
jgi:protein-S-isoprenylcysteine O-methyltransferase Ste14